MDNCDNSLYGISQERIDNPVQTYAACAFAFDVLVVVARLTLTAAGTVVVVRVVDITTLVDVETPCTVDVTVRTELTGLYLAAHRALTFAFDFSGANRA